MEGINIIPASPDQNIPIHVSQNTSEATKTIMKRKIHFEVEIKKPLFHIKKV